MYLMEPELPQPHISPEQPSAHVPERPPVFAPEIPGRAQSPEQPAVSPERGGGESESQGSGGGDPSWQATPVPVVVPVAPAPVASAPAQSHTPTDSPLTANDDDVIEQEWVQKAKKIVVSTKDDPYLQEKEVSKLQADYLQKRYGKELKLSSE